MVFRGPFQLGPSCDSLILTTASVDLEGLSLPEEWGSGPISQQEEQEKGSTPKTKAVNIAFPKNGGPEPTSQAFADLS